MPIGAITMILTNVGLQIYNNWCGSRQNKQLQQKREEFEQAARERNTQRMWQLMREGQELTRRLEEEKHQLRLEELKNDIGSLLQKLTYAATINNWPLNVLPIVMKNQALGNLLANQEESIALHCIFTPSNSLEFNRTVFPRIEEALEAYCNQHWSVMSDHPILFYSGAWKSQQSPTEVQMDSMRTALSNLPTLLITPFFRPNDDKLVFHVRIWGVGASSSDEFSIPEIESTDFQRNYQVGDDYVNDTELKDELIEDLVPYLQCLIGYMADTYFWSSLGKVPHLPLLVTNGTINTDGMRYLVDDSREYYDKLLLTSEENAKENPFIRQNILNLCKGSSDLWDEDTKKVKLEKAFLTYVNSRNGQSISSIKDALNLRLFSKGDIPFIETCISQFAGSEYEVELISIKKVLDAVNFDYNILESTDVEILKTKSEKGNAVASYRLGEIYEYSICVDYDGEKSDYYYAKCSDFFLTKIHNICRHEDFPIDSLEESELKALEKLYSMNITQAVLYYVIIQSDTDYNSKETLRMLDSIEFSNHPYVYYWGANYIRSVFKREYISNYLLLMEKSANLGYIEAIKALAIDYMEGSYLSENPTKHIEYIKKAVRQSDLDSIVDLGICYLRGYGVPKSKQQSIKLLRFAAEQGSEEAIEFLSKILK